MMELGNMVFGHSRGRFELERGAGFEDELYKLFNAYAPERDNSWREYGEEFENEVFSVFPYYWDDCTCGYEERWDAKDAKWCAENNHSEDCYQTELERLENEYDIESGYKQIEEAAFPKGHGIFEGFDTTVEQHGPVTTFVGKPREDDAMEAWRRAHDARNKAMDKIYASLCRKYKQSRYGCAVHCTCDYKQKRHEWCATDHHDTRCPIVRPNFLYKPTGYEIRWYKYPLRDSYQSHNLNLKEFSELISVCIGSLQAVKA